MTTKPVLAIVGLGYVGLPLAVAFSKHYKTIGFDVDAKKLEQLQTGYDRMGEVEKDDLLAAHILYTADAAQLKNADIIIVAVPTPVDDHNIPDLTPIEKASRTIGKHLKQNAIVVYESTVYPGVTEEIAVPILEQESGLTVNKQFYLGYSPERIVPGDKEHSLEKVVKIVSGSTPQTAQTLKEVYGSIVKAGIHVAPSIRVAEAAKIIENVQRDINIALMNELTMLFDRLDVDIHDVLAAAGTKWNFHRYTPGLVGGHCIGVDPYYLTYKAVEVNYDPQIILAARGVNDRMHSFYVRKLIKQLNKAGIPTHQTPVVVFGLTFKENCPDYRNSRTKQLIHELKEYGFIVYGVDPWLSDEEMRSFDLTPLSLSEWESVSAKAAIITVPHKEFYEVDFTTLPVVVDIKGKIYRS